jgi:hypothetical protein
LVFREKDKVPDVDNGMIAHKKKKKKEEGQMQMMMVQWCV